MSINSKEVTHLADLARLKTDASEAKSYATQLSRIFELVAQMNDIPTDDIIPMSHPQELALRLREDEAQTENQREAYQEIAPATENGLYLAPKVIE